MAASRRLLEAPNGPSGGEAAGHQPVVGRSKLVLSFRRDCRTRIMILPKAAIPLASVRDRT